MDLSRTAIILLALATVSASTPAVAASESQERISRLRFLALADWGGQSEEPYCTDAQHEVANGMASVAAAREHQDGSSTDPEAEFVLALGDNFYGSGLPMDDWDNANLRFEKTFEEVYSQKELKIPW